MTTSMFQVRFDQGTYYFEAASKAGALNQAREFKPHCPIHEIKRITEYTLADATKCIEYFEDEPYEYRPTELPYAAY